MGLYLYPETIFTGYLGENEEPRNRAQEKRMGRHLAWVVDANRRPDPKVLRAVPYFPKCVEALEGQAIRHPWVVTMLSESTQAGLTFLKQHYDFAAPAIEKHVITQGDRVCDLLLWAKGTGTTLMRPMADYFEILALDPYWAKYYADQTGDTSIFDLTIERCEACQATHAGAAWFMALDAADPLRYKDVIAKDPLYALLATQMLRKRGMNFRADEIQFLTPQWAFHFLAFATIDQADVALDVCKGDPAWFCELLNVWDKEHVLDQEILPVLPRWEKLDHPFSEPTAAYVAAWSKKRPR